MPHLPDHATHDPELIAAYAAGDATGPSLADATELVAECADCAALHRDLRAIAVALPALPARVRPRDFRLTPEQAASLAPSGWRAVLAAFATPRFRLAAPLGTGLAAIGLAGLLLGTPGSLLPAGAAGTAAEAATGAPAGAADAAAPIIESAPSAAGVPAASAAASEAAVLAPQAVPAPAAEASALPDRAYAAGAGPAASAGRNALTADQDAPSASIAKSGNSGQALPAPGRNVTEAAGSPLVPVLAAAALLLGLALIFFRLLARRLA